MKYPAGTVRKWKTGSVQKQADGSWKPIGAQKRSPVQGLIDSYFVTDDSDHPVILRKRERVKSFIESLVISGTPQDVQRVLDLARDAAQERIPLESFDKLWELAHKYEQEGLPSLLSPTSKPAPARRADLGISPDDGSWWVRGKAAAVRDVEPFIPDGLPLEECERQIRGRSNEFMVLISDTGDQRIVGSPAKSRALAERMGRAIDTSVACMVPDGARLMHNAVLTHNHPYSAVLSRPDMQTAVQYNLKEVRATVPDGGYWSATRPGTKWPPEVAVASAHEHLKSNVLVAAKWEMDKWIRSQGGDPKDGFDGEKFDEAKWYGIINNEFAKAAPGASEHLGEFRFVAAGSIRARGGRSDRAGRASGVQGEAVTKSALPIGTVRQRKGGKFKKTGLNKWVLVTEASSSSSRRVVEDDASYERHARELGAQIGLAVGGTRVGHKPGGGAVRSEEFGVSLAPAALKRALGTRPNAVHVDQLVKQAAAEAAKEYGEKASVIEDEIREKAAMSGATAQIEIKLIDQALSELIQAVPGEYRNDRRQGEIRALELLAHHFGRVRKSSELVLMWSGGVVLPDLTAAPEPRRLPITMGPPPEPNRDPFPYVGTLNFNGILIYVENAPGSTRSGRGHDGKKWSITMQNYYGEIPGTHGADGDPVDVYVGYDFGAPTVYVLHQVQQHSDEYAPIGTFDEDKLMLGFSSREEALRAYAAHFDHAVMEPGVTEISVTMLRDMFAEGELDFGAVVKACSCQDDELSKDDAVGGKIRTLMNEGYPQKQSVAIALDMKRRGKLSKAVDQLPGGKADHMQPSDFDDDALAEGMAHELEHTESLKIAREIAMDHLAEDRQYYKKLKTIEKGGGAIGRAIDELVEQGVDHADAVDEVFEAYNKGKLGDVTGNDEDNADDDEAEKSLVFELVKGRKALPIGWVSYRKDGHYRKDAPNEWNRVDPNSMRWEPDPGRSVAALKPGDVVTVASRDGLWMVDPSGKGAVGTKRSVRVISLASDAAETVRHATLQPLRPKMARPKKRPPPRRAPAPKKQVKKEPPPRKRRNPEWQPGLDESLAHPSEKARMSRKFKGSRAEPDTVHWKLENGEYALMRVKDRVRGKFRWTVNVPQDDQPALVEQFTPLMHRVALDVAKKRPFVPMRRGGELTPEYEEILSGAKLGLLMTLRNYDGSKPFIPVATGYMTAYASQGKRAAVGSARPWTERQRRLVHTFLAAQFQATKKAEKKEQKPSNEDIANSWYITKRQVYSGDAGSMGSYATPGDFIDQAYEPVPMESWQVFTPTGEPRGKVYPGKLALVEKMKALVDGGRVTGFIDEEGQGDRLLFPPDMPAGLVEHVKGEIEIAVERLTEPNHTIIRMLAGLHDDSGPDWGGKPATNQQIGRVLASMGLLDAKKNESNPSINRKVRPLIEAAKQKLKQIAAARGYTAEKHIDGLFPEAPAVTITQEHHGTWYPSHSELRKRWGDNWSVHAYFESIRNGDATETARVLDKRKAGTITEHEENTLRKKMAKWRDENSAREWAHYREAVRHVDPSEAHDSGLQGGNAETMLTDDHMRWLLRTVGSTAEAAQPIPSLARHLPPLNPAGVVAPGSVGTGPGHPGGLSDAQYEEMMREGFAGSSARQASAPKPIKFEY